jgi:hypothetical protein
VSKFNHACKFYAGTLREFYALNDAEIVQFMECFGLNLMSFHLKKWLSAQRSSGGQVPHQPGSTDCILHTPKMKRLNLALLMAGKTNRGDVKSFGRTGKKSIRTNRSCG